VRGEPAEWEDGFAQELVERVKEAERYEDGCYEAFEASEIEERKQEAEACVKALCDMVTQVEEHPPHTIAGVLIHARALAGYADVDKDGLGASAPTKAATILGRGLAAPCFGSGGFHHDQGEPATRPAAAAKKIDAKRERPWDGDVAGDARNLSHLIDALVSSLQDVGVRNEELERASALAWIARDLAEELMINMRK
jgi:hypothetical protein